MVRINNASRPRQTSLVQRVFCNPKTCIIFGFLLVVLSFFQSDKVAEDAPLQHTTIPPPPQPQQLRQLHDKIQQETKPIKIGYAVSVTGCGSDPLTEGAAVLKHSIHLTSSRANSIKNKYDYQMYAIVHPQAQSCGQVLEQLGYKILLRNTPVAVEDIRGDYLRSKIQQNGCCGEKELIKLEAYTLIQHPVIVHLDLDTLILKPLDPLFDQMTTINNNNNNNPFGIEVMWKNMPLPEQVDAFFTRDYNMAHGRMKYKPVQGGFLVLRPSMQTYQEFVDIVKKGDFRERGGWGGKVGPFYGSMTFQGLIPYYYDVLHPGTAVELNRCAWNQMCDNPRDKRTVDDIVHGNCRTGEKECEDCRSRPLNEVYTTHFTLCQKPWWCLPHNNDRIQERLCRKLHHEWYRIRSDLEQSWGRSGQGSGTYDKELFFGYCNKHGKHDKRYIPIATPYGQQI